MDLTPEQLAEYKLKLTKAVKLILPKLDDVRFFMGESCNPDGMVAMLEYRTNSEGACEPYMLFYKHGVESEKV